MDFTGQSIANTYKRVLHYESGSQLFDGTGSKLQNLDVTSSYAISASYAPQQISASYAVSASYALNSQGGGTTLVTGSTYPITASNAISASYSNYTPIERSIVLCNSYTPTTSGPDTGEIIIPHNFLNLPITYSVKRTSIRAQTIESSVSSSVIFEQYSGSSFFTANNTFGQVDLLSGSYQNTNSNITASLVSGDKIRFKVLTLGTATNWTVITEISNP